MIQLLLSHGAHKSLLEKCGRTPLQLFYISLPHNSNCNAVVRLLWNDCINALDDGYPLWLASGLNCLRFVLQNSKTMAKYDQEIAIALLRAISCNYDNAAKLIIEAGVNVNISDGDGTTPLMQAASRKHSSGHMIKYLLGRGADLDLQDFAGSSCTHHIWTVEALEVLLAYEADINARDNSGPTPLLQVLLNGGRFAHQQDPLAWVSHLDRRLLYDAMLRRGADPDIKNKYGNTARMLTFRSSNYFEPDFSASSFQICLDSKMNPTANCVRYTERRVRSIINLCSCLGNHDGKFFWIEGGDFFRSARNVKLFNQGRVLVAELLDNKCNWKVANISLDERIENRNGVLRFERLAPHATRIEESLTKADLSACVSGRGTCTNC